MTMTAAQRLRGNVTGGGGAAGFLRRRRPRPLPSRVDRLYHRSLARCVTADDNITFWRGAPRRRLLSSSANDGHRTNPSHTPSGAMHAFASDWNSTLSLHPQMVLATFLGAQCTTWLGLYASLSAANVALPPSLAAGWAVAKFSKKFRQPVHAALAAMLVRAFPVLGEVKVTPLVTGFVVGKKDKEVIAKQVEEHAPSAIPVMDKVSRGFKWLEGPVDKYGLSYYLSSRVAGASTICISAYLVSRGVDVGAHLSSWGVGMEGVGEAVGTAAGASVLNVAFVPLHFYASVYGVRGLDETSRAVARKVVDAKIEAEDALSREYERSEKEGEAHNQHGDSSGDEDGREREYERVSDGAMKTATLLLLAYVLAATLYSLRLVGETATSPNASYDEEDVKR